MSNLPKSSACAAFTRKRGHGPYVIAEIGVNHEGDFALAKRLIDEAVKGGADCVKFQSYKAEKLASKNSPYYWDLASEPTRSQFELFKKYDSFEAREYSALAEYSQKMGIDFASTPFDLEAVEMLAPYVPYFKIASADLTNYPLLDACAKHDKPVLLSTGASHLGEIDAAVRRLGTLAPEQVGILQCVLCYPTPYEHANLGAINHLRQVFPRHTIGYSDHTRPDPAMLVLTRAYELGAVVIEKHFTHDKTLPGNDHYHAMDWQDLERFREGIDLLFAIEGSPTKQVLEVEERSRRNARRSLVAARPLAEGTVLGPLDLAIKRPAFGLPPEALEWVLGRPLRQALAEDDFLTYDHLFGTPE